MLNDYDFNQAELFVWKQVRLGKKADFNKAEGFGGDLKYPDPEKAQVRNEVWPESRVIRAEFIETLLFSPKYRDKVSDFGVYIIGGWIKEELNFEMKKVIYPLAIECSRLEGKLNSDFCEFQSWFSLDTSWLGSKVNMDGVKVEKSFYMSHGATFQEVKLTTVQIGGQLGMNGSIFKKKLNLNGAKVEQSLHMSEGSIFQEVELTGAQIGGHLIVKDSTFYGKIQAGSLCIAKNLFFKVAIYDLKHSVNFMLARVGGSLRIGNLSPEANALPSIDLSGVNIKGELDFGTYQPIFWQEKATLNLRNASVGNISARFIDWPDNLKLDGFRYEHLGGLVYHADRDPGNWETLELKKWLGKQGNHSPDPYRQMARILDKQGHPDKADEVLYAGLEGTRKKANGWDWLWLFLQKISVGYGFRKRWALIWMFGFWVLGVGILCFSGEAHDRGMNLGLGYSLDMLMPIMRLNALHYTKDFVLTNSWVRWYFYFHQIMGYVLVTFLIAGLSGVFKDKK